MIKITHENNEDLFLILENESIDIICIDPPYKYLKNQKLEVDFNEQLFFENCKRVLTKDGFIIMFGRGSSFYRWNVMLENLGFNFKEEIIWDKKKQTSPAMALGRVHETIAIYSKGKGVINRCRIDFMEKHTFEPNKIFDIIHRIKTAFGNRETFKQLENYYKNGHLEYSSSKKGYGISLSSDNRKSVNRTVQFAIGLEEGKNEQSIIEVGRDHYNTIHPTQKPVRLLERLIQLCIPKKEKVVIADFFGGSFSTMEAVINLSKAYPDISFEGISCELDKEYFDLGKLRIDKLTLSFEIFSDNLDF